jgi:hypothetical protein
VSESQDRIAIPAKRYFTVDEVEVLCGAHRNTLYEWESKLHPPQRGSAPRCRRFYQHHEVLQLRRLSLWIKPMPVAPDMPVMPNLWDTALPQAHTSPSPAQSHSTINWNAIRTELLQIKTLLNETEDMAVMMRNQL